MASVAEAFELARMGNQREAAEILKEEFERLQTPENKVELCEWIADCFENLQDYGQAGTWYELAGQVMLFDGSLIFPISALSAIREYEKALDCYERAEDGELVERCEVMIRELSRSYASA